LFKLYLYSFYLLFIIAFASHSNGNCFVDNVDYTFIADGSGVVIGHLDYDIGIDLAAPFLEDTDFSS